MNFRLLWLGILPVTVGCQLLDPESGLLAGTKGLGDASLGEGGVGDAACGAATFCDDFNRDAAIPPGDSVWSNVSCDPGATLGLEQGTLAITYPPNDGTKYSTCFLVSEP